MPLLMAPCRTGLHVPPHGSSSPSDWPTSSGEGPQASPGHSVSSSELPSARSPHSTGFCAIRPTLEVWVLAGQPGQGTSPLILHCAQHSQVAPAPSRWI